jgi:hypothetical protein
MSDCLKFHQLCVTTGTDIWWMDKLIDDGKASPQKQH